MNETTIKRMIMVECADIAWLTNEVTGNFFTEYGSRIKVGFEGKPDVFGFRYKDGKCIFLETKTLKGKARTAQEKFAKEMSKHPVIYGIVRSVDEARRLIEGND